MLSKHLPTLFAFSTLLLSTTTAAPTRTHCRCTIVSSAPLSPTPDSSHWSSDSSEYTPSYPSSSSPSQPFDICANLGPELENFRHSKPDLYDAYISQNTLSPPSSATETEEEKPLTTTVLLQITARNGFENLGVVLPSAPTERPIERIVCRSESEPFSVYQEPIVTLVALHVIVAIAVLACIAEAVNLVMTWFEQRHQEKIPERPALKLTGAEQRLRAFTVSAPMFSPGVDKKLKVYESVNWVSRTPPTEKREFNAYEEEDDDEINRPVM